MASETVSQGVILWESPDLVAIATGFRRPSENEKTGDMIQTWILCREVAPHEAIRTGADVLVCGDCKLRGVRGKGRVCYVRVEQAPLSVWNTYHRGIYPRGWSPEMFRGRRVRIGAYGDPAMVPVWIWKRATRDADGWTGYTHQWRRLGRAWSRLLMASCDSEVEASEAIARGWRPFTIATGDLPPGHVWCPYYTRGIQCRECLLCSGTSRGAHVSPVAIPAHGIGAKVLVTLGV